MIKTRFEIIALLRQGRWTVLDLAEHIGADSKQSVNYHLLNLFNRGIAKREWGTSTFDKRRAYVYWIGDHK